MSDQNNINEHCSRKDVNLLYTSLTDHIEKFAFGISYEQFKDILLTLNVKPSVSKKIYETVSSSIKKDTIEDLDHFWEESKLIEVYNEFTKLSKERRDKPQAWRPVPPNCEDSLKAYRINALREKKRKLEEIVRIQNKLQREKRAELEIKRKLIIKRTENAKNLQSKLNEFVNICEELQTKQSTLDIKELNFFCR